MRDAVEGNVSAAPNVSGGRRGGAGTPAAPFAAPRRRRVPAGPADRREIDRSVAHSPHVWVDSPKTTPPRRRARLAAAPQPQLRWRPCRGLPRHALTLCPPPFGGGACESTRISRRPACTSPASRRARTAVPLPSTAARRRREVRRLLILEQHDPSTASASARFAAVSKASAWRLSSRRALEQARRHPVWSSSMPSSSIRRSRPTPQASRHTALVAAARLTLAATRTASNVDVVRDREAVAKAIFARKTSFSQPTRAPARRAPLVRRLRRPPPQQTLATAQYTSRIRVRQPQGPAVEPAHRASISGEVPASATTVAFADSVGARTGAALQTGRRGDAIVRARRRPGEKFEPPETRSVHRDHRRECNAAPHARVAQPRPTSVTFIDAPT